MPATSQREGYIEVQGFLFSKPLPAHRIASLLLSEQVQRNVEDGSIAA